MPTVKTLVKKIMMIMMLIFAAEFILGIGAEGERRDVVKDHFSFKVWGEPAGEYDELLFWRLKDNKPDFEEIDADNSYKIFCLTDSVAVMNAENYPHILQEILHRSILTRNPMVFNGGVPGYSSYQGLKYFESELLDYDPDVITVCYGWNDHWTSANKKLDKQQEPYKAVFITRLINRSNILRFVYKKAMRFRAFKYNSNGPEKFVRVGIEDYYDNMKKFVDICKSKGIKIVLMTAPYFDRDGGLRTAPYFDRDKGWTTINMIAVHIKYNNVMREIAKAESVPIIDLVDVFKNRPDLFLVPDEDQVHYNSEGSRIIAMALSDVILGEAHDIQL